jgi:Domain of unknown function (DUF4190)
MTQDSPQTPTGTASMPVQTSSLAIISLISGISSWFVLPILGAIIAVFTGHLARKEIRENEGRLTGMEWANAGLALGYIHLALVAIGICVLVLIIAALLAVGVSTIHWTSGYIRIVP